jgi:PPK2 family polyphosphate:nucleotide phosphotransferase
MAADSRRPSMDLVRRYMVKPGKKFSLRDRDTEDTGGIGDRQSAERALERNLERLAELHYLLYAEDRHAVLVVLQAMDAGGKDGTIRRVMTSLNPQGCHVTSFKVPSAEEANHDFLWRIHRAVPPRGEVGVFNRSHYEDVVVVRVHGLVPKAVWSKRYDQINAFERGLAENGVRILKFFLHISKEEQKKRLEARLADPSKRWKFSLRDVEERERWDSYMAAYEDALTKCSTPWAPWYVIPSDKKWFRNLAVSSILVDSLERLKMRFPRPSIDPAKVRIV